MTKGDVTLIDDTIVKEVDSVDWHAVPEPEAASFGLAVGFFRDSNHVCQLRQTAVGTALGGVLSMVVLTILAALLGADTTFILGMLIVHQALRAGVLLWRARQALKDHQAIERQALDTAKQLAVRYPIKHGIAA